MHTRFLLITASLLLAACSPEKPWMMKDTNITTEKMRIVESRHIVKETLSDIDDADLADAAKTYNRYGAGPVYIAVAYNDLAGKGVDKDIAARAQDLAVGLAHYGVDEKIIVSTVQLDAPIPVAVIAFDTLTAAAPVECEQGPDISHAAFANNDGEEAYRYKLGCGVKSAMAAQIARPTDLEGRAGLGGYNDSERLANIINNDYRLGEPNEFLPSYIISELAGQGN